jgi:hypothetical protein
MKYVKVVLVWNLFILLPGISIAQNANITCIYRETTRKDVTQPVHTRKVPYQNATDISCCSAHDHSCQKRLERSAQEYCKRTDRVPSGYSFSSVNIMCGKGSVGKEDDSEDADDAEGTED